MQLNGTGRIARASHEWDDIGRGARAIQLGGRALKVQCAEGVLCQIKVRAQGTKKKKAHKVFFFLVPTSQVMFHQEVG